MCKIWCAYARTSQLGHHCASSSQFETFAAIIKRYLKTSFLDPLQTSVINGGVLVLLKPANAIPFEISLIFFKRKNLISRICILESWLVLACGRRYLLFRFTVQSTTVVCRHLQTTIHNALRKAN